MEEESFYENLPSGPDSDSDFSSEEENEPEGYEEPIQEPQNTNKSRRFPTATSTSTLPNRFINNQENIPFGDFDQPEAYEEPYEFMNESADGGISGSTFLRPQIPRGPSVPPPPLIGQSFGIRETSFPRPSLFNPSLGGNIRQIQTGSAMIGPRPAQINHRPFQPPSRFGTARPPSTNFGSPKYVTSINPPQRYPGMNLTFSPSSSRPSILPITRQPRPIVNNPGTQVWPRIASNASSPVISYPWKKPNTNGQNLLSQLPPKPQSNIRVRTPYLEQPTIQNINTRPAAPWILKQNAPPLVKSSDSPQVSPSLIRANLEDKELQNSQNPNRAPPIPTMPKPSSSKYYSPISSVQNKPVTNIISKTETLQLDSGEQIPMNESYKSLLNEDYFHPISKESAFKYLADAIDGIFLLRPSRTHTEEKPLTMVLKYIGRTFTFSVEKRKSGLYSIGDEKEGEMVFSTVQELISYYHDNQFHFEGHRMKLLHSATKPSM